MEDRFRIQVVGQEFGKDDLNLVASEASIADDRVLAELLRLLPLSTSPSPARGILPASSQQQGSPPATTVSAVVVPSGSADAKTIINPFRAVIGPTSTTLGKDAYRDIRSAISVGAAADMRQFIQHAAQPTNPRWDLIYAVVDVEIDGTFVNRYVKTDSTPAVEQSISTTAKTRVQLAVAQGAPAATPVRPVLPADSGSSYYIPIAYVLLPAGHTLTSSILPQNIQECSPVLSLSRATGAKTLRIASGNSSASGIAVTNETWTATSGRPRAFLPATMGGGEALFAPLHLASAPRTITLNTTGVVDNSTDWRRRTFKVFCSVGGTDFMWRTQNASSAPRSGDFTITTAGQSFYADFGGTRAALMSLSSSTVGSGIASGASVILYVDMADGALKCDVNATSPDTNFCFWIEATGQFNDAF